MIKLTFARTIRIFVATVLVAVIVVILWYFFSHRRPRAVIPQKRENIPVSKVERQDWVEHLDFKGDRVIQVKAKRHYAGEDGRYVLEGNVEIRDFGKGEGEVIVLSGEKASYDQDWTEASLEGNAKLQYKGLTIESAAFTYLKDKEILASDKAVSFTSRKISGNARRMTYSFRQGSLRLEEEVELRMTEDTASDIPFVTRGDIVTFQRRQRRGVVEGNASFSFGKSHGRADSLRFEVTADEQYARTFSLRGNAQAVLIEEGKSAAGSGTPAGPETERNISADEIDLRVFKNMHKIHSVEARNHCRLSSFAAPRGERIVRSGRMRILFDRWGGLREFYAWDTARLEERGGDAGSERTISGQVIFIGEKGRAWKIKAPEGGEARVDSQASEVTALSLTIYPRRKIMDAAGNVKVILKPRPEEGEAVGFFSSEQPVFGTALKMRYDENADRLQLREDVRMWQGKEILFADRMSALKKTGEIAGEGHVRAVLHHQQKREGAEEEKIEIGGETMIFTPQQHLLTYEQSCWLKSKKAELTSERINVFFLEKTSEIQQIEAQGNVTITEAFREGHGEKALYLPEEDTVILTGNPKIIDKEKGVIEGDKLTFRLGEGRIQVENKDRERSTTVIKS
jgi:lipopolysaccharide transport protein LptA/LPS export ABC transporter protein LptC